MRLQRYATPVVIAHAGWMELRRGQPLDLGALKGPRGSMQVSLRPLGAGWVVWVRASSTRQRKHLGVLTDTGNGFAFVDRRGHGTGHTDWFELVTNVVRQHR